MKDKNYTVPINGRIALLNSILGALSNGNDSNPNAQRLKSVAENELCKLETVSRELPKAA